MERMTRIIVIGLLALSGNSAFGAPVGYSVNSDQIDGDHLYQIDLETGTSEDRGIVQSATTLFSDVEGLAFDRDGILWGLDDQSLSLFPVSIGNGTVPREKVATLRGLQSFAGNDFGMTFSCSGELFVSSVADRALYRLGNDGVATRIGTLDANISALAAYGNPARLYGLGNGLLGDTGNRDSRSLFEINTATAAINLVGDIGDQASDYFEAGLSFDDQGRLWAITDRNGEGQTQPSEILELSLETGQARLQAVTQQSGFESLAVAAPAGCEETKFSSRQERAPGYPAIPSLDVYGKLATVLVLLFAGFLGLRSRP